MYTVCISSSFLSSRAAESSACAAWFIPIRWKIKISNFFVHFSFSFSFLKCSTWKRFLKRKVIEPPWKKIWNENTENIYQSVYLSVSLSVCLSTCLSVCLFVYLFISMSVCLSICLSVCLSVCLSELKLRKMYSSLYWVPVGFETFN